MHPTLDLNLPELEWLKLLRAERQAGKSVSQIARETGMARPSVSMLLSGTYPAESLDLVTRKHGSKVIRLYRNLVACPHRRENLSIDACRELASAPMSTSNPERLAQWDACQKCPLNPLSEDRS